MRSLNHWIRIASTRICGVAALAGPLIPALLAAQSLTTLDYTVSGQVMQVTPAALSVPKGIPGSIGVSVPGEVPSGSYVEATLRGPSFPARRLVGQPNAPLLLPPLNLVGEYALDGIRLVSVAGDTLLEGLPGTVPVRVFDEVLVSRVTSRPLSLDEIEDRGIEIDDLNFRAVEFEVAFVVDGKSFPVKFPVIAPSFRQTTEIIPAAELEARLVQAELINQQLSETVGLPKGLETVMPQIQVKGINMEFGAGGGEDDLALSIPPIPALMVIPGNIGFLNQFFSVQIFTENAAPTGSGLSVHSLTAELVLPPGPDLVAGSFTTPGDDPLRFARVNGAVRNSVPVRAAGADGKTGTSDDIDRLQAGDTGQGELLVEGLQEGLHVMDLKLTAQLDGLAAGAVAISGKAAGSILVRNPKFSMAFTHPRTVRFGEPYEAVVTILNTSGTVANLVSVELNANNISGGLLESPGRVELASIAPGETRSATFRIRSQKTGAITFSNLTTSDDSVIGRFRLKTGVDERGVALSPDSLVMPDFFNLLPPGVTAAAQRVLGQAMSIHTAGQLPAGVLRVGKSMLRTTTTYPEDGGAPIRSGGGIRLMELLEAAQRVRFGEPLSRVLPDLLLDWQGGRQFDEGWDQLVRTTDAGREWREALMLAMEHANATPAPAVTRLADRSGDFAGRGEAWCIAASDRGGISLSFRSAAGDPVDAARSGVARTAGYHGAGGDWLAAAEVPGRLTWKTLDATGATQLSLMKIAVDGSARELLWRVDNLPAGGCAGFDLAGSGNELQIDDNCDGTVDRTLAASETPFTELPPQVLAVRQDPEVHVARPSKPCLNPNTTNDFNETVSIENYANVIAVLFSKPMTQDTANVPSAYRLENGNEAAFVQMQPGGRVALLTMKSPVGALIAREMTVSGGVKDTRGNPVAVVAMPLQSLLFEGVSVKGRVIRADGSFAANVPVTLTYNDSQDTGFECQPWIRRMAQVRTDATGAFGFDFVVGGIPYSISATDTAGLPDAAVDLILGSAVKGEVDGAKLEELASLHPNTLLAAFTTGAMPEAIAKAEGLDRALVDDMAQDGRFGSESNYALRFRGRGAVTGQVVLADGTTPVAAAAANLFPDVNSREQGRGILTDRAGRFAFFGVPLGPFTIEATTPTGLTRTVSGVLLETGATVDLVVSVGATPPTYADWQGRLTEPDGTPVAGGPVYVGMFQRGSGFVVSGRTVTDAGGYWSIPQIPVGSYTALGFSLDGKRTGSRGLTSVAGVTATANIVLQARATVEGVVQFANGDPVAGAVVGGGEALVKTDSLGRFTLAGVPTGTGRGISAGMLGDDTSADPRKHLTRIASAQVNVQAGDNFVVIRFASQGRIVGQLLDGAGAPVPNETVALPFPSSDPSFFLWVRSDAQGRYEFPGLALDGPIGGAYDLSSPSPPVAEAFDGEAEASKLVGASAEEVAAILGKALAAFTGVNNPLLTGGARFNPTEWGFTKGVRLDFDGETEVANIRYSRKSNLSGTVKNGQGVPIGARVRLTGIGPNGVGFPTFVTRAEKNSDPALGTFEFTGEAFVGDWGLQAASPFFPVVVATAGRTTSLAPNVSGVVLEFPRVQEINGSLSGQILLPDGTPAGANIEVRVAVGGDDPRVLRTDGGGRFTTGAALFSLRGNTSYQITVFDPATGGKAQGTAYVTAAQDNRITLTLLGRGTAEIFVKKADGTPAKGAAVDLQGGRFPHEQATGVADGDGRIVFSNLVEGPYAVTASATIGLTRVAGRAGVVVPLDQAARATVTLAATATLSGTFVASDGVTPIPFANVRLGSFAYAPTNALGRFSFVDVPLGVHVLTAVDQVTGRGGNATVALTLTNEIKEVRLVETSLGTISGLVLNALGTGTVPNAEVELQVDDAFALTRSFKVTSGPDGAYSIAGVTAGSFTVTALGRLPNGLSSGDSGSVRASLPVGGSSLRVDIPFAPRAGIVVNVFERDGTTPAANAAVHLFSSHFLIRTLDADPQGRVTFGNLALASYAVIAVSRSPGQTRNRSNAAFVTLSDRGQETQANAVLRGVGSVQGIVVQADGTTPAAGAEVKLEVKSSILNYPNNGGVFADPVVPFSEAVVVGADGAFSFPNLPAGLPVELSAKLLGLAASETVAAVVADQTTTRNLTLTASGTLVGRVLREDGTTAAAGTDVVVEFPSRSGLQGAILQIIGTDGRFSLAPVPQGNWSVKATDTLHDGLAFRSGEIVVNGETDDLGDIILDESFPTVTATTPADTTAGVDIHTDMEITFSEPIQADSLNATGVFVRPASGGAAIPATVTQTAPNTVRLTPTAPLASETTYQLVVVDGELRNAVNLITHRGPRDRVGRPLQALFTATFTTRDQQPPQVLSFSPAHAASQVDPRTPLRLSFDEPIQSGAVLTLNGPSGPIAGTTTLGVNNLVLTFVPAEELPVNATLTASVTGIRDLAGNVALHQPLTSTFATLDTLGPVISQLRIKNGLSPTAGATLTFEAVLATPETGVTFRLSANAVTVGSSAVDGLELPFTLPASGTVVFRGIASDRFGNEGPLAELSVSVLPNTPPVITLTRLSPLTGPVATGSTVSLRLSATDDSGVTHFKAAMTGAATAPLKTTSGAEITLVGLVKSSAGPGDVITLLAQATDTSGAGTGEQSFTIPLRDGTSPTLALNGAISTGAFAAGETITVPVRGRDNFGVTRYTLTSNGAITTSAEIPVDPAATDDSRLLSFTMPADTPVTGEAFTLTLRAGDAAGLLSPPLVISLRTADQTPPQLIAITPLNNAVQQSTRITPTLTANEALDPATVTPETVQLLRVVDGSLVPATVALNAAGTVITLTPVELPLAIATAYRLVATTGLTDSAGNALSADVTTPFTTADFRITAPLAGLQLVEGQPLAISVVSGLGFPTHVRFALNGVVNGADALAPPFQRTVTVPPLASVPDGLLELLVESRTAGTSLLLAAVTTPVFVRSAAADTDSDGFSNARELAAGSDPFRADADDDPDGDGRTNAQEIATGTQANDADSDDDFLSDGAEFIATTNPLDPDTDDDGLMDGHESLFHTHPKLADSDGDTLSDGFEVGVGRYFVVSGSFTYDQATADAATRGGHLVTVVSAKEQAALEWFLGSPPHNGLHWIGAADRFVEGSFRWQTGELSGFSHFAGAVPIDLTKNAVLLSTNGFWSPEDSNRVLSKYILELGFFTDPTVPDTDGDSIRDEADDFIGTPNAAPVAVDDSFFANAGETVTIEIATDLLGDDSDPNGDPLALAAFTQPAAGGTVSQPDNTTVVYTPAAGFNGTAAFSYTIVDAGGLAATASVSITVGINTRPVAGFSRLVASNHALRFDGVDDFVRSALSAGQNLAGGPWTIEAWVKPTDSDHQSFPTIYSQGSWRASLGLNATTGKFDSWVNNAGQLNSTVIPPLGGWTHVAVTYDGTTRRFIIDGVEAGALASTATTSDGNPVYLGAAGSAAPDSRSYFQGTMDEVRIWQRALSALELAANRHDTLLGTEPGLAVYWPFEEGTGGTTTDAVGRSTASLGSTAATAPEWVVSDAPVVGFRQDETAATNTQLLVRLAGSDADGNPLSGKILSLPANGRLFQFTGGAAGAGITSAGTAVSDPQRRVIYEPNPDFNGVDGFRFSVSDGGLESFPARLAVTVFDALDPLAADVWDAGSGAVVTASSPMATAAAAAFDGNAAAATFADGQPAGFTHFIEWETPATVEISGARLFADDNGPASAAHGFSELRLLGRMTAAEPFKLLATYRPVANPYFGELRTEVAVAAFIGTQFRAEFDAAIVGSGPRVGELDAMGETVVMVPSASDIVLQNATASASQSGFPVGLLIDGITTGSSGWAGDVGGTPAMTAVFESQQNLGVTTASVFTFTLPQMFGGSHFVGCFRLSATTADRSTFADGLATGGDITTQWTVLQVVEVTSTGGETLAVLADGSVLVTGNMPATTSYTVKANGISGAVTGFRLELLEHPALPNNGPGRVGHGNWVLTELLVGYPGGLPLPNRAPRGTPDLAETLQGVPLTIHPLTNDSDPDGDPITLASFEQPPAGTGSVTADGISGLRYTPDAGFVGTTSFSYRATDGFQPGKPMLVTLTVRPSAERRWINPAGGNWSVAANWLNGLIPGADELAIIDVPGTYTVNVDVNPTISQLRLGTDTGTQTLSLNSSRTLTVLNGGMSGAGGRLQLNAGIVTIEGGLTIQSVSLGGGTLSGTGTLTVGGSLAWTGGAMTGTGSLVVAAAATGTIGGPAGKTIAGGWQLVNQGSLSLSGANLTLSNGNGGNANFDNCGTFTISDGAGITWSNFNFQPVFVTNSGTLVKSGAGTTTVFAPTQFTNSGEIRVDSGTLQLAAPTTHSGTLNASAGSTLNLSAGTFTLATGASLAIDGTLRITGGTLAVNDAITCGQGIEITAGGLTVNTEIGIPSLTMSGGTLAGTGTLTVADALTWTGGAMTGTGSLVVAEFATGTIGGPAGKTIAGGWQLVNHGSFSLSGANLTLSNNNGGNTHFDNRGTFTISDGAGINWSNFNFQPVFFTNSGTLVKSGAGTTTVFAPTQFTNSGEIRVDSGTLQLAAPTTHSGTLNASAGSTLNLSAGTFTLAAGASLAIDGTLRITGGTLAVNDAITCGQGIEITAGGLTVNTEIEIPSLTMSGGTLAGTGVLTVADALTWTGGAMTGTGSLVVAEFTTGTIGGPAGKTIAGGWQLVNQGSLSLSGANLTLSNGNGGNANFDNRGTFTISDGAGITWSNFNFQPVFMTNSGTLVKSGAGTTTVFSPTQFTNSGEIRVDSGTLQLAAPTTHSGTLNASAGSTLNLSAGTFTLATGASLAIDGTLRITGGTLAVNDAITCGQGIEITAGGLTVNTAIGIPSLTMSGGTLAGTGTLTIADALTWIGGAMTGTGSLVVAAAATGTIGGPAGKTIAGGWQLVNHGSFSLSGANLTLSNNNGGNTHFDNRGTFTISDGAGITWSNFNFQPVFFTNSGTLVKSGAGTTSLFSPTQFTNSGLVSIQGGVLAFTPFTQTATGITHLAGGSLSAGALTVAAGRVTGVGTIAANVTNSGAVFSPGETGSRTLGITGTYLQQAGGTLEFDLDGDAASGAFDRLAITGAATLNGTVVLRNALALTGEVFPLITYPSRSGTFPTLSVTNSGSATASYQATRVEFTVTAQAPPAGAPQLAATYAEWINGVTQTWAAALTPTISPNSNGFSFDTTNQPVGWNSDPSADPDGDGSANLLEYALQTNPLDPASCSRLVLTPDVQHPGWLVAVGRLRSDSSDVTSQLEESTDLVTWRPVAVEGNGRITIATHQAAPGINQVTIRLNPAGANRSYLRWNVRLADKP